ncbi:MAG: hypothetical protein R3C01_14715 [Planctomycetaceae bacterium]
MTGHRMLQSRLLINVIPLCFVMLLAEACLAEGPLLKVTTKRDDDTVNVSICDDQATLSIRSPFGISHAVVQRVGKAWPQKIQLQIHLKGLENLKITTDKVTLEASVSSQTPQPHARVWLSGNEEEPLDATSPYAMPLRLVGKDGKPANRIPLDEGYIEASLPYALFDGNPESMTISWIDFYR